mmetsp:Transcript_25025/g.38704  ORF Transcript_25025/g.38704 Transcript_25025/m.38704 type:complete len:1734 (+) Transcript_25025:74-5275(+)
MFKRRSAAKNSAVQGNTKLFDRIKEKQWTKVIARAKKAPRECSIWVVASSDDGRKMPLLPIHLACWLQPPLDVIKVLVDQYPESLTQADQHGRLPVHLAVAEMASEAVILHLTESDPSTARSADQYGELPLHICLQDESVPLNVVEILVKAYPQGVYEANVDGVTPLKMARLRGEGALLEVIGAGQELSHKTNQQQTKEEKKEKKKSIVENHQADEQQKQADFLLEQARQEEENAKLASRELSKAKRIAEAEGKKLSEIPAYKKAISPQIKEISTPPTSKTLGDQNVGNVDQSNDTFKKPSNIVNVDQKPNNWNRLYNFISRKDWKGAINWLSKNPQEADQIYFYENGSKKFPLMECVTRNPSEGMVAKLVEISYRGVITSNAMGMLPLHVAVMHKIDTPALVALLQNEYKTTAQKSDNNGNLPLHLAYTHSLPKPSIYKLISAYPGGTNVSNRGGQLPHQCAPDFDPSSNSESKESFDPETSKADQSDIMAINDIHLFIQQRNYDGIIAICTNAETNDQASQWIISIDASDNSVCRNLPIHIGLADPGLTYSALKHLVQAYPTSLFCTNHKGQLPLHIAVCTSLNCGDGYISIIRYLLEEDGKRAASIEDLDKKLPVDYILDSLSVDAEAEADPNSHPVVGVLRGVYDDVAARREEAESMVGMAKIVKPRAKTKSAAAPKNYVGNSGGASDSKSWIKSSVNNNGVAPTVPTTPDPSPESTPVIETKESKKSSKKGKKSSKNKSQASPQPKLHQYIQDQNWAKLLPLLTYSNINRHMYLETKIAKSLYWKRTILHDLVRLNPPLNVIQQILKLEAAHVPDATNRMTHVAESMNARLSLHMACETATDDIIINALLTHDPESVRVYDSDGCLPIHVACMAGCPAPVFWTLLAAYPESITIADPSGQTPTQISEELGYANKDAVVATLSAAKEEHARKYSGLEMAATPIDPALTFKHTLARLVKEKFHYRGDGDADKDGARTGNDNALPAEIRKTVFVANSTLFRMALRRDWAGFHGTLESNVDFSCDNGWIISQRPLDMLSSRARDEDTWRCLMLHLVCRLQPPKNIVIALMELSTPQDMPQASRTRNGTVEDKAKMYEMTPSWKIQDTLHGMLPLHLACLYGAGNNVVSHLIALDLETVSNTDNEYAWTPLHCACMTKPWDSSDTLSSADMVTPSNNIISSLLSVYSTASRAVDTDGNLPLHLFLSNVRAKLLPSIDVLYCLLQAYPESARVMNNAGETPLQVFHKTENNYKEGPAIDHKRAIIQALLRDATFWVDRARMHPMELNQDLLTKTGTLEQLLLVTSPIKSVEDTKRRTLAEEEQVKKNLEELKFEAKQREEFDATLAEREADAERERLSKLEIDVLRAKQVKAREEKKAEEDQRAKIAEEKLEIARVSSAIAIQRTWRGYCIYWNYFTVYRGILRLQAQFRMQADRSAFQREVSLYRYAIKLQCWYRSVICQHKFKNQLHLSIASVILLQKYWRGKAARSKFTIMYEEAMAERNSAEAIERAELSRKAKEAREARESMAKERLARYHADDLKDDKAKDFRSVLSPQKREKVVDPEEDDEEIDGIFDFKETERATVLFSRLNTMLVNEKWTSAIRRCHDFPGEATLWIVGPDDRGLVWKRLPLHFACCNQPAIGAVEALVQAFPESPSYKDNVKSLPLHYACAKNASYEVIQLLLKACPNATLVKDRNGKTPLDLYEGSNNDVVELLKRNVDSAAHSISVRSIGRS